MQSKSKRSRAEQTKAKQSSSARSGSRNKSDGASAREREREREREVPESAWVNEQGSSEATDGFPNGGCQSALLHGDNLPKRTRSESQNQPGYAREFKNVLPSHSHSPFHLIYLISASLRRRPFANQSPGADPSQCSGAGSVVCLIRCFSARSCLLWVFRVDACLRTPSFLNMAIGPDAVMRPSVSRLHSIHT